MEKTVLIVDDEKSHLQVMVKYLKDSGENYRIICAPNGRFAVQLAETKKPLKKIAPLV